MISARLFLGFVLVLTSTALHAPNPFPQPSYLLVYEDPTGASSIEDYGLSLQDCWAALMVQEGRGWACELGEVK
jgi:hypothetical protein